jgi:leucyl aminopeptidase (aminopeptidase T)
LESKENSFEGTISLPYHDSWLKEYRFEEIKETTKRIWQQGYALKKDELVSVGFVLVPSSDKIELPLEDYLDSYQIAYAFGLTAIELGTKIYLGSSTDRESQLAMPVKTVELSATLRGCEYDKDIAEDVFKAYKRFSDALNISRMRFATAGFTIHAKGYFGRHFFGEEIGYPTKNKKSRWPSPGQMMLKDSHSPQSFIEERPPVMRYAITETLPIDIFIETCNIDYREIRKRSTAIRDIFNRCEKIRVVGNKEINGYKTDFSLSLKTEKGKRRYFTAADSDVTNIVDKEVLERTGHKTGSYANFPSGETFTTPENMNGIMAGDVVINVNRSYRIPKEHPIIVEFKDNNYNIISAPENIKKAMDQELKEGKEKIKNYERTKSMPEDIIQILKDNFTQVGEFALNTNPKAKLCDYLIVNEKIARMIHVALGLGFEPERKTMYHWDIVVDSPAQELDIFGIDKDGKEHWVVKKGNFVV